MVAEQAGIKEGDYILDVCAAPGGKALHAAQILNGTGMGRGKGSDRDEGRADSGKYFTDGI